MVRVALLLSVLTLAAGQGSPQQPPVTSKVEVNYRSVAPGRYVLRVEARALLSNGPTVARELEFRVR